ncbi:hypothetical protein D3C87_1615020 [compost metagenome]
MQVQRTADNLRRNHVALQHLAERIDDNHEENEPDRNRRSHDESRSSSEERTEIRHDIKYRDKAGEQQRIRDADQRIPDIGENADHDADDELAANVIAERNIDVSQHLHD